MADDQVLLVKHRKMGWWLYPGGHLEPNEDPEQAVRREVREEVGLEVEIVSRNIAVYSGVVSVPPPFAILVQNLTDAVVGPHQHIDMVYVCRPVAGPVIAQVDEIADHAWVPIDKVHRLSTPDDLPELIADAVRYTHALTKP